MRLPFVLILMSAILASSHLPGRDEPTQVERKVKKAKRGAAKLNYWLHVPKGEGPHPLLLFLHGKGERGNNLDLVKKHGPPKLLDQGKMPALKKFVVVSPQCPDDRFWKHEDLKPLLDEVLAEQKIDRSRIYVTGLSMGGFGTFMMAEKEPKLFAAAIPICGGGDTDWARTLAKTPIWAFHGKRDTVVPPKRSEEVITAIEAAGGKNAKLTVYPLATHDSWSKTYANPEVYAWLLRHSKGR